MKIMNKCFIGIDFQNGFIEGGHLAVNGGKKAADNAVEHLKNNDYKLIALSCDWHPHNHCSFTKQGGKWPEHCIAYTSDAAIYEQLILTAYSKGNVDILRKGENKDVEEYSCFDNKVNNLNLLTYSLLKFDEFVVCGIAGDFCVLETLKSMLKMKTIGSSKIKVLINAVASIDGDNRTLINFCKENKIEII